MKDAQAQRPPTSPTPQWLAQYAPSDQAFGESMVRFLQGQGLALRALDPTGPSPLLRWAQQVPERLAGLLLFLSDATPTEGLRAQLAALRQLQALHPGCALWVVTRAACTAQALQALGLKPAACLRLPDQREPLEAALHQLVEKMRAPNAPAAFAPQAQPWPGLRAYQPEEAALFYGRQREVIEGIGLLEGAAEGSAPRWLRVEGGRAVGKTSLLRAGLSPALLRGGLAGGPARWQPIHMRFGAQPLQSLITALAAAYPQRAATAVREQLGRLGGLVAFVREQLAADEGLLLVVDHLEDAALEAQETQRALFDGRVSEALSSLEDRFLFISATHSAWVEPSFQALPRCAALAPQVSAVLKLGGLSPAAVAQIIEGPLRQAGWAWPDPLRQRLRQDALAQLGHPAALAWVLYALAQRGEQADLETYQRWGSLGGALARALDGRVTQLSAQAQERARSLCLALIQIGRGRPDAPRGLSYERLLQVAGGGSQAEALVEDLLEASSDPWAPAVLRSEAVGTEHQLRFAHSALLEHWPWLVALLKEDRPLLERAQAAIEAEARTLVQVGPEGAADAAGVGEAGEGGAHPEALGLPAEGALHWLQGADLPQNLRARLQSLQPPIVRLFLEQAQGAQDQQRHQRDAARDQWVEEARQLWARQLRSARRLLWFWRVVAVLFLGAGGTAAWLMRDAAAHQAGLEQKLTWANERRQEAVDQLRVVEEQHRAAQQRRLTAERERRETERARRHSVHQSVQAQASADVVLDFAVEAAVEADEFFSRINHPDARYTRRMYAQTVLEKLKERIAESPENPRLHFLLARQHSLLGDLAIDIGAFRAALPEYEAALDTLKQLAQKHPEVRHVQALAQAHTTLGRLYANPRRGLVDLARAAAEHEEAVAIWQVLAQKLPEEQALAVQLADTQADLGVVLLERGQAAQALELLAASAQSSQAFAQEKPEEPQLVLDWARRLGYLAQAQAATGGRERAIALYTEAIKLLEPLAVGSPESRTYDRSRAKLRRQLKELRQARP